MSNPYELTYCDVVKYGVRFFKKQHKEESVHQIV